MKNLSQFFLFLLLIVNIGVCDEQSQDGAIKELDTYLKKWSDSYNKQDVDSLLSLYDEKADVIYYDGVQRNGRKDLRLYFNEIFSKNRNVVEKITNVKRTFLSSSIVLETGVWQHFGVSNPLEPTAGRYSCTLRKDGDQWLIVHDRAWALKDADSSGSKIKSRDKFSLWAKTYLEGSIVEGLETVTPLLHRDVIVFVNDLKVSGKDNYVERLRLIQQAITDASLSNLHIHTNYFSKDGLASNGLTWNEVRATPSIWSNCWAICQATSKKSGEPIDFRFHADLRWEDDKIVEMLFFYDPQQLNAEMGQ